MFPVSIAGSLSQAVYLANATPRLKFYRCAGVAESEFQFSNLVLALMSLLAALEGLYTRLRMRGFNDPSRIASLHIQRPIFRAATAFFSGEKVGSSAKLC